MYIHTSYYVYIVLHCINTYNDAHISIRVYIHSITFYTSTCGWWSRFCDSFWSVFTQRKPFKSPWMLNTSRLEHQWAHIAIFIKTSASLTDHFDPYPLNFCWTEIHRLIIIFAIWWPCVGQSLLSFHSENHYFQYNPASHQPTWLWSLNTARGFSRISSYTQFSDGSCYIPWTPKKSGWWITRKKPRLIPMKSEKALAPRLSQFRHKETAVVRLVDPRLCVQASTDQGKMCLSTSPISRGTILSQDLK